MRALNFHTFRYLFCCGMIAVMSSCAPRGETHTLQQVLDSARAEYVEQAKSESDPLKTKLADLTGNLEALINANGSGAAIAPDAGKIADSMAVLIKTAGYPTRPGMGEIIMQHRILGVDAAKGDVNPARVKLLVARTYSLLAAELQGTKFDVQPLGDIG